MDVAGEEGDVVFTGGDDVELELFVLETVRDPTRCVITETVSLDWASVEVPIWVEWLTLEEGMGTNED